MGDKNVIAGDVVSNVTNNTTNNTTINNTYEAKKDVVCHVCGKTIAGGEYYTCSKCGEITCSTCYNPFEKLCTNCFSLKKNLHKDDSVKAVSLDGSTLYSSIQDAINDSKDGDTIKIKSGEYLEDLKVNKKITFEPFSLRDQPILMANRKAHIEVTAFAVFKDIEFKTDKNLGATDESIIVVKEEKTVFEKCFTTYSEYTVINCIENGTARIKDCVFSGVIAKFVVHFNNQSEISIGEFYDNTFLNCQNLSGISFCVEGKSKVILKNARFDNNTCPACFIGTGDTSQLIADTIILKAPSLNVKFCQLFSSNDDSYLSISNCDIDNHFWTKNTFLIAKNSKVVASNLINNSWGNDIRDNGKFYQDTASKAESDKLLSSWQNMLAGKNVESPDIQSSLNSNEELPDIYHQFESLTLTAENAVQRISGLENNCNIVITGNMTNKMVNDVALALNLAGDTNSNLQVTLDLSSITGIDKIEEAAFLGCKNLVSIKIPNKIKTIGKKAFHGCSGLKSVYIPENVSIIEDSAFTQCNGLEKVQFSAGLRILEDQAFGWCKSLKTVQFQEGLQKIGALAFTDCPINEIDIPKSVRVIDWGAFDKTQKINFKNIKNWYFVPFENTNQCINNGSYTAWSEKDKVNEQDLETIAKGNNWLFCKDTGTDSSENQVISDYFVEDKWGNKRQIWFFVKKEEKPDANGKYYNFGALVSEPDVEDYIFIVRHEDFLDPEQYYNEDETDLSREEQEEISIKEIFEFCFEGKQIDSSQIDFTPEDSDGTEDVLKLYLQASINTQYNDTYELFFFNTRCSIFGDYIDEYGNNCSTDTSSVCVSNSGVDYYNVKELITSGAAGDDYVFDDYIRKIPVIFFSYYRYTEYGEQWQDIDFDDYLRDDYNHYILDSNGNKVKSLKDLESFEHDGVIYYRVAESDFKDSNTGNPLTPEAVAKWKAKLGL